VLCVRMGGGGGGCGGPGVGGGGGGVRLVFGRECRLLLRGV